MEVEAEAEAEAEEGEEGHQGKIWGELKGEEGERMKENF